MTRSTPPKRQDVLDALTAIIEKADGELQDKLSQALEDYAYAYPHGYRDMTRGGTMVASLLNVLEEASGALIATDYAGLPDRDERA